MGTILLKMQNMIYYRDCRYRVKDLVFPAPRLCRLRPWGDKLCNCRDSETDGGSFASGGGRARVIVSWVLIAMILWSQVYIPGHWDLRYLGQLSLENTRGKMSSRVTLSVHKIDYPTTSRTPGYTHRQRVLSNLKNLLTKRISMKTFNRKPNKLNLDNMVKAPSKDNVYVGLKFSRTEDSKYLKKSLRKTEELPQIRFKMDTSQCARCILGDPSLTCTCSFRQRAPDFKLYEDYDQFLCNFPSSLGTYV